MLHILVFLLFGFLTGFIAKLLHPQNSPVGLIPTIIVGVIGSFIGGGINWVLGFGYSPFQPSGFFMSVLGGIICLTIWRFYKLKNDPEGSKHFLTGKILKNESN